jgi:RNA polymerase sigma-70 factor (ECF subfamily)
MELPVADPTAAASFDVSDTTAAVMAALRRLPADAAAAVVIVDVEGFSVREAAEILAVPEGTVKSRCARARARLAELLSDLAPQPSGNETTSPPVQRSVTDSSADRDR